MILVLDHCLNVRRKMLADMTRCKKAQHTCSYGVIKSTGDFKEMVQSANTASTAALNMFLTSPFIALKLSLPPYRLSDVALCCLFRARSTSRLHRKGARSPYLVRGCSRVHTSYVWEDFVEITEDTLPIASLTFFLRVSVRLRESNDKAMYKGASRTLATLLAVLGDKCPTHFCP